MLKENWRLISYLERIGDNLIILISFFFSYYARDSVITWLNIIELKIRLEPVLLPIQQYFPVLFVGLIFFGLSLEIMGAYGSMRLISALSILKRSIVSGLGAFIGIAATLFLLKLDLSRVVVILFCILSSLGIALQRLLVLRVLRYWRAKGRNFRNIFLFGLGETGLSFTKRIVISKELGLRVVGVGYPSGGRDEVLLNQLKQIVGNPSLPAYEGTEEIEGAFKILPVDEILIAGASSALDSFSSIVDIATDLGVRITIIADFVAEGIFRSGMSYFEGIPLIHYQAPPGDRWQLILKRFLDFIISTILLVCLSPLLLIIALAIWGTSGRPILFKQKRVGLNGRIFSLYKFRTMDIGAEAKLEELRTLNEMSGPVFKIKKDPRVTPIGSWLRRFSLDELPQFWNVLRGDMSLVGPRPPIPNEVKQYERKFRRRLSMRPGLTCTWQVSGRNEIKSFDSWVELDLCYIDNWSLSKDLWLMLKTIPAVLRGIGAR